MKQDKKYQVILADPPWRYENPHMGITKKSIEYQYPTMTTEEIKNLQIPSDKNCILYLWATAPKLKEAFEVITAWNFNYRTCMVWDKVNIGLGYWFRNRHELLLLSIKGKVKHPIPKLRLPSIYREKRTGHSVKPDFIRYHIEKCFPCASKLEMFARNRSDGWDSFGNELSNTKQQRIKEIVPL